jgi:hypothetical protein
MKLFLPLLLACSTLFGSLPFTLDNLQNLRIVLLNKTDFIPQEEEAKIKESVAKKLQAHGIEFDKQDANTLMIKIDTFKVDETFVVHTQFVIGEEVQTRRKEQVGTLAFTYHSSDLIDTQEPYADTIESIEYLANEFLELYDEDNAK